MYKNTIPAAGDIPSQSQPEILENFAQLETQIGTEHTALTAAIGTGKHKYVTLVRNAIPGPPAGTDISLGQSLTISGNPYFSYISATQTYGVPTVVSVGGAIANGTHTIFDFATLPQIPQAGTLHVFNSVTGGMSIFTFFVWLGGILHVRNTPSCQFVSGSVFTELDTGGSNLTLKNTGPATTFYLKITGSSI